LPPSRIRQKPALAKKLYLMALKVSPKHPGVRRNYALLLRDCPELRSGHSRIVSVPVRRQRHGSPRKPGPPRGAPGNTFGAMGR
jgi:hypothetical protein